MVSRINRYTAGIFVLAILLVGQVSTAAVAQDGRINAGVYIGGANVYCVNASRQASDTYANGGGILVLDQNAQELLFVPEAAINTGIAQVAQTGQYATLGVSERLWYGGAPVALYRLTSDEFQLNAFDNYEKLVELRWTECGLESAPPAAAPAAPPPEGCDEHCRNWALGTNDGCLPGWDWAENEQRCVFKNLY